MRSSWARAWGRTVNFGPIGVVGNEKEYASGECKVYKMIDGVKTLVRTISRDEEWKAIKGVEGDCSLGSTNGLAKDDNIPVLVSHPTCDTRRHYACMSLGTRVMLGKPEGYHIEFGENSVVIGRGSNGSPKCHKGSLPSKLAKEFRERVLEGIKEVEDGKSSYYIIGERKGSSLKFRFSEAITYISKHGLPPWVLAAREQRTMFKALEKESSYSE